MHQLVFQRSGQKLLQLKQLFIHSIRLVSYRLVSYILSTLLLNDYRLSL